MHSPYPAPIPADMLLLAYRNGIFPMADSRDDPEIFWVEPRERAIIPLEDFRLSRSLAKTVRQDRYQVTLDRDFAGVMRACAAPRPGHPESWISERIEASYRQLHTLGHAHSIECWEHDAGQAHEGAPPRLVGGLYGVSFDRVFCGESMFSTARDASKVALAWLVALMRRAQFQLLDCQFMTDHLASLGALEIPQSEYLDRLVAARNGPSTHLKDAFASLAARAERDHSSPGKLIAQSFTQTS